MTAPGPMDYHEVMRAELSPDVYSGPDCDQVKNRWEAFCEGDMDSDFSQTLELSARHFPPGTKVLVLEPVCPECHQISEFCRSDEGCAFDWDTWIVEEYS